MPQMQETGNEPAQNQPVMPQQQSPNTSSQILMSPGIGPSRNERMASNPFGGHGSLISPLYPDMTPPHRHTPTSPLQSRKRPRPEDFDLATSGLPELQHSGLESMTQTGVGAPYAHPAASGSMMNAPGMSMTHHHHHLPNLGPASKLVRREDSGLSMPTMVGQEGMPTPAPRPRGPKLKFTAEDDQLLILLKEQKNLTWKQIADFFPGRSSGTLQVRYCTKLKAKTTLWTEDMDQKLRHALQDYDNEKWRIVAHKVGSGFTPAACRERAGEMGLSSEEDYQQQLSPVAGTSESGLGIYPGDGRHMSFGDSKHQLLPE